MDYMTSAPIYGIISLVVCIILGFITKGINESKGRSGGASSWV